MSPLGPIGRLGHWTATHFRAVVAIWALVAVGLGIFAPRVEHALSGAGWEATGSESVKARELIDANFGGLGSYGLMVVVHSPDERPAARKRADSEARRPAARKRADSEAKRPAARKRAAGEAKQVAPEG